MASDEDWTQGVRNIYNAFVVDRETHTLGTNSFPEISARGSRQWTPSALQDTYHMIDRLQDKKNTLVENSQANEHENGHKMQEPRFFRHIISSATRNGIMVWYRNLIPSHWPGKVASGVTLCYKFYNAGYRG